MIYIIPIEFIILFILLIIVGGITFLDWLSDHILGIATNVFIWILFFVITFLLFKLFIKLYKKNKDKPLFIGFILILSFWLLDPIFCLQLEFLDVNEMFLNFLGKNSLLRYYIVLPALVLTISLIILILSSKFKNKIIQSILCLLIIIPILIMGSYSSEVCAESYSNSVVEEIANQTETIKYTVNKKASIFYTVESDYEQNNVTIFPIFSPLKYSIECFEKGDTVYAQSFTKETLSEYEYVLVSDGKKGGLIKAEALR